jgi:Uma2 family endonuclease
MLREAIPVLTDTPSVKGPPPGHWTYTDWQQIPPDFNRYEVIAGVLYASETPSLFHQWIVKALLTHFGMEAHQRGLGYAVIGPFPILMGECQPIQPDIIYISRANKGILHEPCIRGVSDLIVEVVAPDTQQVDLGTKLKAYQRSGVPEYAAVVAATREVRLYTLGADGLYGPPRIFEADDILSFACLPGIECRVRELFDGSPDETL